MAEFPVDPNPFDPYENFKFRLKWDAKYIAGVSKVSALKRTTEVIEFHDGGDAVIAGGSKDNVTTGAVRLRSRTCLSGRPGRAVQGAPARGRPPRRSACPHNC
jgi:hypothetical protein